MYPALIRKTEKKDIRILLQEGRRDLDNLHGHWPLSNKQVAKALEFKGYDHKVVWGMAAIVVGMADQFSPTLPNGFMQILPPHRNSTR